jgi:protein-S-isoprenylcysteine O-methyltransferase Ste14
LRLFPFTDRALRGELYNHLQFSIVAAMSYVSDVPAETVFSVVVACWLGFGAIVVIGKKGTSKTEKEKDFRSHAGFLLQCIAYAICFIFHRRYFSSFMPMPRAAELILSAVATAIAVVSEWFCFVAARALGKQWALVARVVHGHELVNQGPYSVVRNPIYLAMLGMLVATGLAVSHWQALVLAFLVFLAGNEIRIRSEERLLREEFGAAFDDYARRVPAIFPRIL